ncbi:MAG: metallophosphoesterase, partial [Myxococcales bacterium]|nr:metallophosphoesterase [Myxococcales bacterium]
MIVLGDLHLTRFTKAEVGLAFADLCERHPDEPIVVAGDFFDLSTDAPRAERAAAIEGVLAVHEPVRRALGRRLDAGQPVVLIGGNHDADLGQNDVGPILAKVLRLGAEGRAALRCTPWFWRHRGVHLEHGHLYDPDNAPGHPLIVGEPSLGVHFSAEFIHPTGAHRYLQNNDETPLKLLVSSFQWYGRRAPYVIYRYFHAAFAALARSGPLYRAHHESERGSDLHAHYAIEAGVPASVVDQLFAARAPSTLESLPATFARLYLDRVVATLLLTGGLACATTGRPVTGGTLGTLGALLMGTSWLAGHNRYRGNVVDHLTRSARHIAA